MQDAGIVVQQIDEAAVVGVLLEVRLLLGNEQAEERLAVADGGVGLDHLAGEARDLQMVGESVDAVSSRRTLGSCTGACGAEVQHGEESLRRGCGRFAG